MAELQTLPNIEFLGQVAPDKTMQIIADASVLLSTSDEEGFPNTLLEAWASGTPVVTLKIDPDNLIRHKGLGAVSGTVERAIDDLTALLDSPLHRTEIALRAQRYIAEQHSEEAITGVFEHALGVSANTTTPSHPFRLRRVVPR
jgi:glycosyltransferase involved in cell wall biosynthesis